MSIVVEWDNEGKTVIRYEFSSRDWTWHDFYAAAAEIHMMMDTVDHQVDAIAVFQGDATLPPGALAQSRRIGSMKHPNTGMTVVVRATAAMRAVYAMYQRAFGRLDLYSDIHFVDTLAEARTLITKLRGGDGS